MIGKFMDDRRDSKLETIALSRRFESSTMKHVGSFCSKLITQAQDVEAALVEQSKAPFVVPKI